MRTAKTREHELAEREQELFRQNVEKVRALLVSHGAEDLIPMLLSDLGDRLITELAPSPNGGK
jgi:hypothetical protein